MSRARTARSTLLTSVTVSVRYGYLTVWAPKEWYGIVRQA
jgi:hypothetical protein